MLPGNGDQRWKNDLRAELRRVFLRPIPARARLMGTAFCLAFAGCRGPQSMLEHAGPEAAAVVKLWWLLSAIGMLVLVGTTGFLIIGCIRHPSTDRKADARLGRGMLAAGLATIALLFVILIATHSYSQPFASERERAELTIEVTGKRWWWKIEYPRDGDFPSFETANEIHIPVGVPVRLRLLSADVIHSFWVPSLGGKIDLVPGRTNFLWIEAAEPGIYRGQCAEFCGIQHAKMAFLVVAMPPEEFAQWRRNQAAPAAPPQTTLAARGQEVFSSSLCADCHAIRGVASRANLGPDLTHLASRRTLAAATLPNRKGHLAGWVADPQSVKPGNLMPAVPLSSEDFRALLHYLEGLE